jgi:hypothetical protein
MRLSIGLLIGGAPPAILWRGGASSSAGAAWVISGLGGAAWVVSCLGLGGGWGLAFAVCFLRASSKSDGWADACVVAGTDLAAFLLSASRISLAGGRSVLGVPFSPVSDAP